MNPEPLRLLYMYAERIPENLRQLVIDSIPADEFVIDRATYALSTETLCEKMRNADVVLFAPGRYLPEIVFRSAGQVKLMQLWSSGYDRFNIEAAQKYGIPVANNGGANAIAVAEHTILLMLAIYKWLPDSHRRTVEGAWAGNSHGMDMFSLQNKTLGIIGFGNIGKEVAKRAAAFGMRVLYYDPVRATPEIEQAIGVEYADFDALLAQADIVTLHLHLSTATKNMLGQHEFERMKEKSVLINVSRAQLVDEQALLSVLNSGRLWAAGLDVHSQEPTQSNDPLLTHPRVVATPHMAGSTFDAYIAALNNALKNFRRVKSGQKPLWIVNSVR